MTHLKAIVAAAALVFMLPATAQTLSQAIGNTNGTSASTPLEPAFQYHRLSFSYAPLFIGETVNGISFGYTYGANCSRTHPFFFENPQYGIHPYHIVDSLNHRAMNFTRQFVKSFLELLRKSNNQSFFIP